jgi:predicted nucleic acid-binding protein
MATLIDATLWVDFTRARTPPAIKRFIAPFILDPSAHLAEPIEFELLRFASDDEKRQLSRQFQTLPHLQTPTRLWGEAAALGQTCRKAGFIAGALNLLIATVAIHHDAELITFDSDFLQIATSSKLRVKLLERPSNKTL